MQTAMNGDGNSSWELGRCTGIPKVLIVTNVPYEVDYYEADSRKVRRRFVPHVGL